MISPTFPAAAGRRSCGGRGDACPRPWNDPRTGCSKSSPVVEKAMNRRQFPALGGATLGWLAGGPGFANTAPTLLRKPIPSSGESIPAIGMGTDDVQRRQRCRPAPTALVLRAFFDQGGGMIDCRRCTARPRCAGDLLARLGYPPACSRRPGSDSSGDDGPQEIEQSRASGACRASTCCRSTICWPGDRTWRRCSR